MRWVKDESGPWTGRRGLVGVGRRSLSLGIGGPNLVSAGPVELVGARVVAPQAWGGQRFTRTEIAPIVWPRHAIRFNAF
jgi:hypothetical protein